MKIIGYDIYRHNDNTTRRVEIEDDNEYTDEEYENFRHNILQKHRSEDENVEIFVHTKRKLTERDMKLKGSKP